MLLAAVLGGLFEPGRAVIILLRFFVLHPPSKQTREGCKPGMSDLDSGLFEVRKTVDAW